MKTPLLGISGCVGVLLLSLAGCSTQSVSTTAATPSIPPSPTAPAPSPAPAPPAPAPPPPPSPSPGSSAVGYVFTASNDASGNAVQVLTVGADGTLALTATVSTGGSGSGGGLENQGGLAFNEDRSLLFVVNAGSNDFSVFRVSGSTLTLASRTPSGGSLPISISEAKGFVYVLNVGGGAASTNNISGFSVATDGTVQPIANSTRPLSQGSTTPAQVAIGPAGDVVLVTERGTGLIDAFPLDTNGNPGHVVLNSSSGSGPFGFQFLDTNHVFIVEEGANAVSSYSIAAGKTTSITKSAANFQSATCWLAIAPSGQFLFTTNTSSGTISAFNISSSDAVSLIGSTGVAIHASGRPIDEIVSPSGQFLYVVDAGGSLDAFRIAADGSLTLLQTVSGLGVGLNGVVAD